MQFAVSWLDWVGRDDHQKMLHFVRFDNYLPRMGSKPRFHGKTAVYHVAAKTRRTLQHQAQIDSVKVRSSIRFSTCGVSSSSQGPPLGKRHS